ncbi:MULTISPECIES: hypothetical protein [unclassified Microbacterium]|uniref:hypothetical protein n=1 Tax=unclassified Microbacterium TaxID=2609290 RepID=UPI00214C59C8|nr:MULTISPECIES: hypothetical protein [unclassified Microbacterium]MCR2808548.1 hypothetical protein [Microbacterium sp. zg.B185]WIM19013.1 hypothetical protein QNO12_15745 [Microbacterium sp. zg-B185]
MIGVLAPAGAYRVALAELPRRTRLVDRADGAVVVLPGDPGWVEAGLAATAAGARALVVADPAFAPAADIHLLVSAGIPVVVERPLLRADAAGDARDAGSDPPRTVVADGAAPAAQLRCLLRDAMGWLRVLSGAPLRLAAADGALALLETSAGITASLTVVGSAGARRWIRAHALAEAATEVQVVDGRTTVARITDAGRLIAPARFESSERLAVRRALDALDHHRRPADLDELVADTALADRIAAR